MSFIETISEDNFLFICSSELRMRIVLLLLQKTATPGYLTDLFGSSFSQVSRALGELSERDLINVLDPDKRKNREYTLSETSMELLRKLSRFLNEHLK